MNVFLPARHRHRAACFGLRALAIRPDDNAIVGLGVALQHRGQYDESAMLLARVLPPVDSQSDAMTMVPQPLAVAYLALDEQKKAAELLRRYYDPETISRIEGQLWRRMTLLPQRR